MHTFYNYFLHMFIRNQKDAKIILIFYVSVYIYIHLLDSAYSGMLQTVISAFLVVFMFPLLISFENMN